MFRFGLALFVVASAVFLQTPYCVVAQEDVAAASVQGIVTEKPTEGRSVDLGDGRFMVPYTATIPGTEVEFSMEPIPGGTFTMGNENGEDDQQPAFKVELKPFWIAKHEVTWAEYKRYMQMEKAIKVLQATGVRVVDDSNEIDAVTAPSSLCLLYTSPSPRDLSTSRMPSSA